MALLRSRAALAAVRNRRRGCDSPGDELSAATLRTARGKHNVLIALIHVGHRQSGLWTCRKWRLPDVFTRLLVIRMKDRLAGRPLLRRKENSS